MCQTHDSCIIIIELLTTNKQKLSFTFLFAWKKKHFNLFVVVPPSSFFLRWTIRTIRNEGKVLRDDVTVRRVIAFFLYVCKWYNSVFHKTRVKSSSSMWCVRQNASICVKVGHLVNNHVNGLWNNCKCVASYRFILHNLLLEIRNIFRKAKKEHKSTTSIHI